MLLVDELLAWLQGAEASAQLPAPWRDALAAAGGWSEPRELRVTVNRPADPEGIPDYLVSMSWVAALDEESRREMLTRAAELVSAGETPDELPVHFRIALARLEGSSR